ncbi:MAG: Co2+/Mg2+ efflux protein ApaG [Candidatus Polarisedimenticolia bacterium]|nr:Co2+/Mg2+ efflux protein ApaG [bacterium]
MGHSVAQTEGVRVEVRSFYLPDRSEPARDIYFFGYRVRIANEGQSPVRLVSRHWIVTDGEGRVEHVRGPGVVGEQPRLEPGEAFEYTSFCPLPSSFGAMRGSYQMVRDDGSWFDAVIDSFSLEMPRSLN